MVIILSDAENVEDGFFSCVAIYAPRATFGALTALTGSTPLGRVSSMCRQVHRVRPWPPSTSKTTIDAPPVDDSSAPTSSGFNHETFFF